MPDDHGPMKRVEAVQRCLMCSPWMEVPRTDAREMMALCQSCRTAFTVTFHAMEGGPVVGKTGEPVVGADIATGPLAPFPCSRCGAKAVIATQDRPSGIPYEWRIVCVADCWEGPGMSTERGAVEAWNELHGAAWLSAAPPGPPDFGTGEAREVAAKDMPPPDTEAIEALLDVAASNRLLIAEYRGRGCVLDGADVERIVADYDFLLGEVERLQEQLLDLHNRAEEAEDSAFDTGKHEGARGLLSTDPAPPPSREEHRRRGAALVAVCPPAFRDAMAELVTGAFGAEDTPPLADNRGLPDTPQLLDASTTFPEISYTVDQGGCYALYLNGKHVKNVDMEPGDSVEVRDDPAARAAHQKDVNRMRALAATPPPAVTSTPPPPTEKAPLHRELKADGALGFCFRTPESSALSPATKRDLTILAEEPLPDEDPDG